LVGGSKARKAVNDMRNMLLGVITKSISYVSNRRPVIGKFLIVSGSAVALNLLLLFLMVRYLGFSSPFLQNVANALSMELSIIYNFFMSRAITWGHRHKEKGIKMFIQLLGFNATIGVTILMRLALFPSLQHADVPYLLNATIGIALAAIFNFFIYDRWVFKREG
jgi:dolichol-phosphate mannosyltransferase